MSSSSSSTQVMTSSSSSSTEIIDINTEVLVAMASRTYGQGRVLIHTDRMGGVQTGHGANPNEFWRGVFEWASNKKNNELIKVALVINTSVHSANRINSYNPITVERLDIPDLALEDLSGFDCIYIVGLPPLVSATVTNKIASFVENGGGLILEYPNRSSEYINILVGIDDVYCYSSERLLDTYAYWTIDGGNSSVFYDGVDVAFMSTFRQSDFSHDWTILMTNIQNVVTTTTTTNANYPIVTDKSSSAVFGISYISAFQNGIITLVEESARTVISAGDTITVAVGINESFGFEYISRDGTYATVIVNGQSYVVGNVGGYLVWDIGVSAHTFTYIGEIFYIEIGSYLYGVIYDGRGSLDFTIAYTRVASSSSSSSSYVENWSSSSESSSSSSSSISSNSSSSSISSESSSSISSESSESSSSVSSNSSSSSLSSESSTSISSESSGYPSESSFSSSSSSTEIRSSSSDSSLSFSSVSDCACTSPNCTGDACLYISNWFFMGMMKSNSNNCTLYVMADVDSPGPAILRVYVYKDAGYIDLVCSGNVQLGDPGYPNVILSEDNASGLSGSCTWDETNFVDIEFCELSCT